MLWLLAAIVVRLVSAHKQRVARIIQVREILHALNRRLVILNNYIGSAKDHMSWVVRSSVVYGRPLVSAFIHTLLLNKRLEINASRYP